MSGDCLATLSGDCPRITDFRLLCAASEIWNNYGYYRLQKWAAIALARYLVPARGLDPWRRPKGSWALGTRMSKLKRIGVDVITSVDRGLCAVARLLTGIQERANHSFAIGMALSVVSNFRRSLRVASPRNFARARVCISPAPQSPSPKLETTRSLACDSTGNQSVIWEFVSELKFDRK